MEGKRLELLVAASGFDHWLSTAIRKYDDVFLESNRLRNLIGSDQSNSVSDAKKEPIQYESFQRRATDAGINGKEIYVTVL